MVAMTAEEAAEWGKTLTFEKVWAALMKTDEQLREGREQLQETCEELRQTREQMRESRELVDKQLQESREQWRETRAVVTETSRVVTETSRKVAEMSANLGGIGNTLGKMTEAMFSTQLWKKFSVHGFKFTKGSQLKFWEGNNLLAEVDFFLENGEYAMPVEIKTELSVNDVNDHLERMAKVRQYMDERNDHRKLVGAVAGAVVAQNVLRYAQRKGFFVLVQTGDSVTIAEPPQGFKAREW